MNNNINRKDFLKNSAKYVAGAAIGMAGFSMVSANDENNTDPNKLPWKYAKLDVEEGRILGHDSYSGGGCGFAGFHGLMKMLQDKVGEPFTNIPTKMMSYGGGGIKGWGTVCGAINSAAAVINLVCDKKNSGEAINELFNWYSQSKFPTDVSNKYAKEKTFTVDNGIGTLPQSISNSPLCHASVTNWCSESGIAIHSKKQKERCARLSGDVVAKTIEILNNMNDETFMPVFAAAKPVTDCGSCHSGKGEVENTATKMNCISCHEPHVTE